MEIRKTVHVRVPKWWAEDGYARAYYAADVDLVRVQDDLAGHYTVHHPLTKGQVEYVKRMTKNGGL